MNASLQLIELVRKLNGHVNPPCSEAEIVEAEQRLGFALPQSIREFYRHSNGASMSESLWNFFKLEELEMHGTYRSNPDPAIQCANGVVLRSDSLMIFADAMIDAPSYWLCIDPAAPGYQQVYCDGDNPWWLAASSYENFVDKLETNIEEIFMGADDLA